MTATMAKKRPHHSGVCGTRPRRMILFAFCTSLLIATFSWGDPPRTHRFEYDLERKDWVESPPPPAGSAAGDLHVIRAHIGAKRFSKALSATKAFAKRYGANDALQPDLLVAKAESLIGLKEYEKAHKVLQEFLNQFAGVELTEEALRLEFIVAEAFLAGVKRKIWGIFPVSAVDLGYEILDSISTNHADSPLAQLAIKTKGDHLFRTGDHSIAELEYSRIVRDHPTSRYQQYASRRTAEAALASFAGVEYDEAALIEAEERFKDYRARYPSAADREGVGLTLDGIREARAEKDFLIGSYYERTNHLTTAVFCYKNLQREFPDSIAAGKAKARLDLLGAAQTSQPESSGDNR